MAASPSLSRALAEAAADIHRHTSLPETLDAIALAARDAMPAVDHVGVTLADGNHGALETAAATDDLVREIDKVQFSVRQGPCVEAVESGTSELVVLEDARHSGDYHDFVMGAVPLGLRSTAAIRLFTADRTIGVLNLYSTSTDVLDDETRTIAELFALHASYAYGHRHQVSHLQRAIESREVIGNAVGIVMERYQLDRGRAFEYLVRVAATSETKVRLVAEELVSGFGPHSVE
ncbi:MAG: hypothetical protein JWN84_1762 [Nocardioides sp.]|nr:hypothetical protein [Nocardioides sp.]